MLAHLLVVPVGGTQSLQSAGVCLGFVPLVRVSTDPQQNEKEELIWVGVR